MYKCQIKPKTFAYFKKKMESVFLLQSAVCHCHDDLFYSVVFYDLSDVNMLVGQYIHVAPKWSNDHLRLLIPPTMMIKKE